jgi:hypothetical protein
MAFRFRRTIKIMPGLRLNVGKRGVSASVGVRGAHVTVGKTGTRSTVGLPGTGASWTDYKPHTASPATPPLEGPQRAGRTVGDTAWTLVQLGFVIAVLLAIFRALMA